MLIVMAGLPGTGKSTLARALAQRLHAIVLDKDRVRAALFSPEAIEYSTVQDDFCISIMLQTAAYLLHRDPETTIILDGRTFSRRCQRKVVIDTAQALHTPFKLIECVCRDATALMRLQHDQVTRSHPAKNRDAALYHSIKAHFEPIDIPHLVVDTDQTLDMDVEICLHYIAA